MMIQTDGCSGPAAGGGGVADTHGCSICSGEGCYRLRNLSFILSLSTPVN